MKAKKYYLEYFKKWKNRPEHLKINPTAVVLPYTTKRGVGIKKCRSYKAKNPLHLPREISSLKGKGVPDISGIVSNIHFFSTWY